MATAPERLPHFKLPEVEDFNERQEQAFYKVFPEKDKKGSPKKSSGLKYPKRFLVAGGPGTGKSIVILEIAKALAVDKRGYWLLAYNKMLKAFNEAIFRTRKVGELQAMGWIEWTKGMLKGTYSDAGGNLASKIKLDSTPAEWEEVLAYVKEHRGVQLALSYKDDERPNITIRQEIDVKTFPLLIDEGHDMPPQFYELLDEWGFTRIIVAADDGQIITESGRNSSIPDICGKLSIDTQNITVLEENYRNSSGVHGLVEHFRNRVLELQNALEGGRPHGYQGELLLSRPKDDARRKQLDDEAAKPYLQCYDIQYMDVVAKEILGFFEGRQGTLGVITPNFKTIEAFCSELQKIAPTLGEKFPFIQVYTSKGAKGLRDIVKDTVRVCQEEMPEFGVRGIYVLNAASCKGLEFDWVFLLNIDGQILRRPDDKQKWQRVTTELELARIFNVMAARGVKTVALLRDSKRPPQDLDKELRLPEAVKEGILVREQAVIGRQQMS